MGNRRLTGTDMQPTSAFVPLRLGVPAVAFGRRPHR